MMDRKDEAALRAQVAGRRRTLMKWILAAAVVVVALLHQDYWLWRDNGLVLGVLPVGLAYHVGYSILAAVLMAVLVRYAWPESLEDVEAYPEETLSPATRIQTP